VCFSFQRVVSAISVFIEFSVCLSSVQCACQVSSMFNKFSVCVLRFRVKMFSVRLLKFQSGYSIFSAAIKFSVCSFGFQCAY